VLSSFAGSRVAVGDAMHLAVGASDIPFGDLP